jgi:hypothetical protein
MRSLVLVAHLLTLQLFATAHALEKERTVVLPHLAASESRTLDDVRRVVDKNKGGFYALYARALRGKPGLQGTIVLSISIAPNGKVTKCAVASSTLNDSELENRIVERFLSIDFGAKGTKAYSNPEYPMSFLSTAGVSPDKRLQPIAREDARSG